MRIIALSYLFVAVGGALGAMARFALNVMLQRDVAFPWGTLSANLLGCLGMGVVAQLDASSVWFNESGSFRISIVCFSRSDSVVALRRCPHLSWNCTRCCSKTKFSIRLRT